MSGLSEIYGPAPPATRLGRAFAARVIEKDLRRAFRRVVWVGPWPELDAARPLVVVANHHAYHDSFALWHLVVREFGRPFVVWMEAWERAPLFGPIGALPFPSDRGAARTRTIRETRRRMDADPRTALLIYPEGAMRPPDSGLGPFVADLPRLARILPREAQWLPVGVRVTDWGQSRPTALLAAGSAADTPDGAGPGALEAVLQRLRAARPSDLGTAQARTLIEGERGPDERWNLARVAPLFRRLTPGL